MIVLPSLAAASTVAVTQSRLQERYQLRENGRRAIQTLYYAGCQRFAQATTDKEYSDLHAELVANLEDLEGLQGEGFFATAFGQTPSPKAKK